MAMRWHRSWWIRGALLIFVLIAALAVAWTIWWQRARSAFDAEVAAYRAMVGFSSRDDIRMPDIPADQDATVVLSKALAAFSQTPASPSQRPSANTPVIPDWPPTSTWLSQAKAAIDANPKAIELAVAASALAKASPTFDVAKGTSAMPMANVSTFVRFLCDSALYFHAAGDDAAAVDCLLAAQSIPRVYCSGHTLIESLIAVIEQQIISPRLHFIATGLSVEGSTSAGEAVHPATRKKVEQLLAAVQDDRSFVAAIPHGMTVEGSGVMAFATQSPTIWITRPLLYRRLSCSLSLNRQIIGAMEELNWPAAEAAQRQVDAATPPKDLGTFCSLVQGAPQFAAVHRDLFSALTARRMATVALAVRLYALDHGAFPQNLAQLVPQYLPAIPADPYPASHDPLGYLLANQGGSPAVLSSGPGRPMKPQLPPRPNYVFSAYGVQPTTLVLDLARPRPAITSPASSAPARSPKASQSPTQPASPDLRR